MKIKDFEQLLFNYLDSNETFNYKQNALKEFDTIEKKCSSDELSHIAFIIHDYPDYDHYLFKLHDNSFFIKMGFSREYLKSLNKKDIHKLAKSLHSFFGKFKLSEDNLK